MHHTAVPINTRPFLSGHVCARVHVVTIFAVSDAILLTFTPTDITANCLLSVCRRWTAEIPDSRGSLSTAVSRETGTDESKY